MARSAIPHADGGILGAGDDLRLVKSNVQHATFVLLEFLKRLPGLQVPYDERAIGRAGDYDLIIILQTEDRCVVIIFGDVVNARVGGTQRKCLNGKPMLIRGHRSHGSHFLTVILKSARATDDSQAFIGAEVPHSNSSVTRSGDYFVPGNSQNDSEITKAASGHTHRTVRSTRCLYGH